MPLPAGDDEVDPVESDYTNMDPSMRILYERRKDYEDSVTLINDTLSAFVDEEEERAQAIFPHCFEKYKTDGVGYDICLGQSMTRALELDEVQLRNLRLWQLQPMCRMARRAEALVPQMKVPLRTTPLVLVHASPLTIHFGTGSRHSEVEDLELDDLQGVHGLRALRAPIVP